MVEVGAAKGEVLAVQHESSQRASFVLRDREKFAA